MSYSIFCLLIDAYGSSGGVAYYNRQLLRAFSTHPNVEKITVLPRLIQDSSWGEIPSKVHFYPGASHSRVHYIWEAWKRFAQTGPNPLILCGHLNLLPLAAALASWKKAPIYTTLFGTEAFSNYAGKSKISHWAFGHNQGWIAISQYTLDRFKQHNPSASGPAFLLPPCIDLEQFSSGSKPEELVRRYHLENKKVILTLGRVSKQERLKGFDRVIRALPQLIQSMPNLVYMICGGGDDHHHLMQMAKELGIDKHLILTGFVPESEKTAYYRLADAFVMPSKGEGFGIVLIEAAACGIPVIGSQADASREALLQGKVGMLVDPDQPQDLIQKILAALQRPVSLSSSRQTLLDQYSLARFDQTCHQILNAILVPST